MRLENEDEAVLGRITSFSSEGRLASSQGEDFSIRAVQENRDIAEDLREQYLKYRVNIRVLGVLREEGNRATFVPSHRRLPHVGSPVAFPSDAVLREIAGHNSDGVTIGHLALGEYVYGRVEVWRGGCRSNISVAAPFVWRCLTGSAMARFHTPLIEPDMQICRIRLSDKTSRLHPRRAASKLCQPYEPEVPVKVREWIAPALASSDFVLGSEPPA